MVYRCAGSLKLKQPIQTYLDDNVWSVNRLTRSLAHEFDRVPKVSTVGLQFGTSVRLWHVEEDEEVTRTTQTGAVWYLQLREGKDSLKIFRN